MFRIITCAAVSVLLVVPAAPAGAQPVAFTDIDGTTHEASIRAVADAGVVAGYPNGTFRPEVLVTRGQMATLLTNALQLPEGDRSVPADVEGTTHEASIRALLAAELASGYPDGTFRPGLVVNRGQMATFLADAFELPEDDTVRFIDVLRSTHRASITTITGAGVASGYSDLTYRPQGTVTRGQFATFLARSLGLVDPATPPGDLADREAVGYAELPEHLPIAMPGFRLRSSMYLGINFPPGFEDVEGLGRIYEGDYDFSGDLRTHCRYLSEILRYNGYITTVTDLRDRSDEDCSWTEPPEALFVEGMAGAETERGRQTQVVTFRQVGPTSMWIDFIISRTR